jgi:hypothetical protein
MTRWASERLDRLADRWRSVVAAGFLLIGAEFVGALGCLVTFG